MSDTFLVRFRFSMRIDPSGPRRGCWPLQRHGAFSEVTGLETSIEMTAFREGGYHAGPLLLIGKTSTVPLILKRGVSLYNAFWKWIQRCMDYTFPLPYVSGSIYMPPPNPPPWLRLRL